MVLTVRPAREGRSFAKSRPSSSPDSEAMSLLHPRRAFSLESSIYMPRLPRHTITATLTLLAAATASAHLTYTGRDFGVFTGTSPQSVTIANQVVTTASGWADGTDANFSHTHWVTAYRFTLQSTAYVRISITAGTNGGAPGILGDLLPAFSIYSGLGHISPALPDYDDTNVSQAYLATLGPGPYEGVFNPLGSFKMGNEDGTSLADLSTFTFVGYGADGTSANFGSNPGVIGDGLADGVLTKTLQIQPGTYTMFVGGANYAAQNAPSDLSSRHGFTPTLSVAPVPEPATASLLALGTILTSRHRRQR